MLIAFSGVSLYVQPTVALLFSRSAQYGVEPRGVAPGHHAG